MITRRDAMRLGAAGLIGSTAAAGCLNNDANALDTSEGQLESIGFNDVVMYGINGAHTGVLNGQGPEWSGSLQESWITAIYNIQRPLLFAGGLVYVPVDSSIVGLDGMTGNKVSEVNYGDYDVFNDMPWLSGPMHAIADGILYFIARYAFCAVMISTGEEVWRTEVDAGGHVSSITVSSETLYVVIDDEVVAFDRQTGKKIWAVALKGRYKAPTPCFDNGTIYVSGNRSLLALDSRTGDERWSFVAPDPSDWNDIPGALEPDFESPVAYEGTIFAASNINVLYAIDSTTGQQIWKFKTEGRGAPPAVHEGVVYSLSNDGNLFTLDAANGSIERNFTHADDANDPQQPIIIDDAVYITPNDHTWIAIDRESLSERNRLLLESSSFNAPPLTTNGHVYITWGPELHAIQSY